LYVNAHEELIYELSRSEWIAMLWLITYSFSLMVITERDLPALVTASYTRETPIPSPMFATNRLVPSKTREASRECPYADSGGWNLEFAYGRLRQIMPAPDFTVMPPGDSGGLFHRLRRLISLVLFKKGPGHYAPCHISWRH
jgi:hypothetical protein